MITEDNGGGDFCLECDEDVAWLVDGRCPNKVTCENSRYVRELPDVACNCNKPKLSNGTKGDRSCMKCTLRKNPSGNVGEWYHQFQYKQCSTCKNHKLFQASTRSCINADECPADKAIYRHNPNGYKGSCEEPFGCVKSKKQGGENPGTNCKCTGAMKKCKECSFGPGYSPVCRLCKPGYYLNTSPDTLVADGSKSCLTFDACEALGGSPQRAGEDEGLGEVCVYSAPDAYGIEDPELGLTPNWHEDHDDYR
jgi:hypothetical protein